MAEHAARADHTAATGTALLRLERVSKRYGANRPAVLHRVDLEVLPGEYLAIMGESGVGKSTLLNLLAGLDRPDSGRVLLDGIDLSTIGDDETTLLRRRAIGFVFQAFHVLPYLTVRQNVALPLELLGIAQSARRARTDAVLEALGVGELAQRFPRELSGGEIQRVAIARALAHRPRVLLADEPTGNLDPRSAVQTLALLRMQVKQDAGAGVLITHSRAAAETADRILILDAHGLKAEERA